MKEEKLAGPLNGSSIADRLLYRSIGMGIGKVKDGDFSCWQQSTLYGIL